MLKTEPKSHDLARDGKLAAAEAQLSADGFAIAPAAPSTGVCRVRPTGQLRPFVASYIDFNMSGWPPGRHRGLPDGTLGLVVSLGTPLAVRRAGHPEVSAAATIAGLHSGFVDIVHDGCAHGVQIELTPRGARALLGRPAADFAERSCSLDEVVGRRAYELVDRLAGATGPAERAIVLDAVLTGWSLDTGCLAADAGYPAAVGLAWRGLTSSAGSVSVASIAAELGLGRRHLGKLIRAELGLTPKTAARVLRFGRARRCLSSGRTTSLADTAILCGYFDQAHMTNEWKQLGGCTPGEWMSQELPFLQDQSS